MKVESKPWMCSLRMPWSQNSECQGMCKIGGSAKSSRKYIQVAHLGWTFMTLSIIIKNVTTLSACQSFEGLRLSNPSCKCLFPIARSCIGTERAAVEQLGSGSCPVWSLNAEVWGDVYLNWDQIQQISMWLLSGEMSVQLDYSLRIEGTTTQYSNTLLTRNARPPQSQISNLAQGLLHKLNWTTQM